jgi:uncharacterized damage-inducible protein DinB
MQKNEILMLYDYNYWAHDRILAAAAKVRNEEFVAPRAYSHGGLRGTLVHALAAEWLWRVRCQERKSPTGMQLKEDDFATLDALRSRWHDEERAMRGYLNSLTDVTINEPIRYKFFDGTEYEHQLWQVLVHVLNHGTQHRSEAAVMLTDLGHSPGNIDLSVYLREQK